MNREDLLQLLEAEGYQNIDQLLLRAPDLNREDLLWVANRVLEQTRDQSLYTQVASAAFRSAQEERSQYVADRQLSEATSIAEEARDQALAAGASEEEANAAGNAAAGQTVLGTISREEGAFIEVFGGTEESALKALDGINDQYGTNYGSIGEFIESDMWYDATVRTKIIDTWGGPPPEQAMRFNVGKETLTITLPEMERAQAAFGIADPQEIDQFMKMAYANDMRNGVGEVAWQVMAALQTHAGYRTEDETKRVADSRQLLLREQEIRNEIARLEPTARGRAAGTRVENLRRELTDVRTQLQQLAVNPQRVLGPRAMAESYREGMKLYNSETFAFFHVIDEGLAARIASNPKELSEDDAIMALGHLQKAGLKSEDIMGFTEQMYDLGFVDPMGRALSQAMAEQAANAGRAGRIRTLPDPVAVRQSAKDFYRQMFLQEPDDKTLDSFAASVSSAIASAAEDQSVDPNARIRAFAESLPEYKQMYGQKPAGMSEEEYQGMHRSAQSSMLGAELADNQPTRIGMMQGQYQTTVGAAMGTKEAWDNSTFLGRLARASQTVGRNT